MTLIAKLSINNVPLLLGDVLLSSESRTGLRANLPLVGDINKVIADRGFAFEVSFAQKVNILGDRLAVAWCGPAMQAEREIRALSAICGRGRCRRGVGWN